MKGYKRYFKMVVIGLVMLLGTACQKEEAPKETVQISKETIKEAETQDEETRNKNAVLSALTKASQSSSFQLNTQMDLELNGTLVNQDYQMLSEIHVVQGKNMENLQMTMTNTNGSDGTVSKAYYKDGWYYTDDYNGQNKEEKSASDVMKTVNQVTNLIINDADLLTDVQKETSGTNQVFTYTIPADTVEDYFSQLTDSAEAQNTMLAGAKANVENIQLTTTVGQDGVLVQQTLSMEGRVSKSVIDVPANVDIIADYKTTQEDQLDIPTW